MNFSNIPTLKHRSLLKIAVLLFTHKDIQELIFLCPRIYTYDFIGLKKNIESVKEELKKVETEALKYVLKLPLPDSLKNELSRLVEAVGWQLIKWREMHPRIEGAYRRNFTKFPWTPQGTIDRKKAAELYVNDESIPVDLRYIVACESCFKDYIFTLWKQLKGWTYGNLKGIRNLKEIRASRSILTSYWSHYMKGKLHLLNREVTRYRSRMGYPPISVNEYVFIYSLNTGNIAAVTYFLEELPSYEKAQMMSRTIRYIQVHDTGDTVTRSEDIGYDGELYADMWVFIISKLNENDQKVLFKDFPLAVLKWFLIWPRQTFFMDLAKFMFSSPPGINSDPILEVQYYTVLKMIVYKITSGSMDYNYKKLLEIFWHESHHTYKIYVQDNYASDSELSAVFEIKDTKDIQLVLKDAFISRKRKYFCD